ncbi:MAG: sugar kinase, partial [Mesorhizobium sp.]
ISFDTEPNELPLIREGCAMRALSFVDQEIFAPSIQARAGSVGKNVA